MTATNQQETRLIGWDPGHGDSKAAEVQLRPTTQGTDELQMITYAIPAVVGMGSTTSTGALNLAGIVRSGRDRARPHVVTLDGISYLVGEAVDLYARPIERMDFDRFVQGPETKALLWATLWPLIDGGSHRAAIAIALPVEIMLNADQAHATEAGMQAWMLGSHHFTVDGQPADVEITAVRARIAQPVATWFEWGLDIATGKWMRGNEAAQAPALILDEGFNTFDVVAIEGARIIKRHTGGANLGMRRAAEAIATTIHNAYGLELSLHQADALTRMVTDPTRPPSHQKARIFVEGKPVDVTPTVRQAVQGLGSEVVRFVQAAVDDARKFAILCTGGGMLALGDRMKRQWPHATIMPEPVTANASALAKIARRANYFK